MSKRFEPKSPDNSPPKILNGSPPKFKPKSPDNSPPFKPTSPKGPPPKFTPKSPKNSPPLKPPEPKGPPPKKGPLKQPKKQMKMMTINTANDALYVARPYIQNRRPTVMNDEIEDLYDMIHTNPVPRNTNKSRWRMTEEALKNTLDYIFDKLSHTCYMLCVSADGKTMFKLSSDKSSPSFQRAIKRHLQNLDKNKLITEAQKKYIREFATGPVRIMQCIMKHFNVENVREEEEIDQPENEYLTLIKDIYIPDGVYILNLTDAVILHNHNEEPFPSVTGENRLEPKYDKSYFIPILSLSGKERYSDIPIPNYDDVQIVLGLKDIKSNEFITNWDDKQINKAVFRGGAAGCGYTINTNQRIKLISMKSPLIDAKIVSKTGTIDSKSIKFDPKYGLGMMNTGLKSGNFVSMQEQSNYKYIIHVDGNVNAYRLLTTMMTGSLILKVQSEYTSWVEHLIEPEVHYLHVKPDLSDLITQIEWCERNPDLAKKIAVAGQKFAQKALTLDYVKNTIQKICWDLPRSLEVYDPHRNRFNKPVTPPLPDKPLNSPKTPEGSPLSPKTPNESPPKTPNESQPKTPPSPKDSPIKTPNSPNESPIKTPNSPTKTPPSPKSPNSPKKSLKIKIPKDSLALTQKRIYKKSDDLIRFKDAKTPPLRSDIKPLGFGIKIKSKKNPRKKNKKTQKNKPQI